MSECSRNLFLLAFLFLVHTTFILRNGFDSKDKGEKLPVKQTVKNKPFLSKMISLYPGRYLKISECPAQEPHKLWDSRPQGKSHSSHGAHSLQSTEADWNPGLEAYRKNWGNGQKHRIIYSKVNLCLNGLVFMSVTSYSQDIGCARWCWWRQRHRADAIKNNVMTLFNGSFKGSALKVPIFKIERENDWFLYYEYS